MQSGGFFDQQKRKRVLRRAGDLAVQAKNLTPDELRQARRDLERARQIVVQADHLTETAIAENEALQPIEAPEHCDWSFRPSPWMKPISPHGRVGFQSPTPIDDVVTLYHDCTSPELGYRQIRNARSQGLRYALSVEIYRFTGSFISIVQDLPASAARQLTLSHYFTVKLAVESEQELELFARLNLQNGPNTEQMVREMALHNGVALAEFDLAYANVNEKRVEKIWLDLILEAPRMNRLVIWDMTVARALRADV